MATGTYLKTVLAPLIGMHPATFDRHLKNLADAGLIRRSGLGGGKAAVHLGPVEYANILLGLATLTPSSGGAEAAKALGSLFPENPQEGDGSLLITLASSIEIIALNIRRNGQIIADDDWELTLSLNPLTASMIWPNRAPGIIRRWFDYIDAKTIAPVTEPVPIVRRQTVLTTPILMIAARLLFDTGTAEALPGASAADADEPSPAREEEPESPDSSDSTSRAA